MGIHQASCNGCLSLKNQGRMTCNELHCFHIHSIMNQHDPNVILLQSKNPYFKHNVSFSTSLALVELVLCKSRPTLISLIARPVTFCSLGDDAVSLLPALQERKTLGFNLGQHQPVHPLPQCSSCFSKPRRLKWTQAVFIQSRAGPRTSSLKVTFPLHLKQV